MFQLVGSDIPCSDNVTLKAPLSLSDECQWYKIINKSWKYHSEMKVFLRLGQHTCTSIVHLYELLWTSIFDLFIDHCLLYSNLLLHKTCTNHGYLPVYNYLYHFRLRSHKVPQMEVKTSDKYYFCNYWPYVIFPKLGHPPQILYFYEVFSSHLFANTLLNFF